MMEADTQQYESAMSSEPMEPQTKIGGSPHEENYFSPRPEEEGQGRDDGVDEDATQEWNGDIDQNGETQAMDLSPKIQQAEGSRCSSSQQVQGDEVEANATVEDVRAFLYTPSTERSQRSTYDRLKVEDRGGVTPDPQSRRAELNRRSEAIMIQAAVNDAIVVATDAFGSDSRKVNGQLINGSQTSASGRSQKAEGAEGAEGGASDDSQLEPKGESKLASVFVNLNSEIKRVVSEVITPTVSSIGTRIQRFHKKAEQTARTEEQAQPFLNHGSTEFVVRNALSVFSSAMDSKTLGLADGPEEATATSPSRGKSQEASSFASAAADAAASDTASPGRSNARGGNNELKMAGFGNPVPLPLQRCGIDRLALSQRPLGSRRNGSGDAPGKPPIPQFVLKEPESNPDLPQVGLGMFSNITKKEGSGSSSNSSSGSGAGGGEGPSLNSSLAGARDAAVEADVDRVLSGVMRRRYLNRPGAESQDAMREAGDLSLGLPRSYGMGSGSATLPKRKAPTTAASSANAAASNCDLEEAPKRKRGRPPKKKRGVAARLSNQQQAGTAEENTSSSTAPTKSKPVAVRTSNTLSYEQQDLLIQPQIAFSGIEPEPSLVDMLSGATLVDDLSEVTHLIVGPGHETSHSSRNSKTSAALSDIPGSEIPLKRTSKLLVGLNSGVRYVVGRQWLLDSVEAGRALPLSPAGAVASMARKSQRASTKAASQAVSPATEAGANALHYIVQDVDKEQQFGFSMIDTLARQKIGQHSEIFRWLAFYVTPAVLGVSAPKRKEFEEILSSAGGLFLGDEALATGTSSMPPLWVNAMQQHKTLAIVVLSTAEAMKLDPFLPPWLLHVDEASGPLQGLTGRVLSTEFVYVSVLRQSLALADAKREMMLTHIAP